MKILLYLILFAYLIVNKASIEPFVYWGLIITGFLATAIKYSPAKDS